MNAFESPIDPDAIPTGGAVHRVPQDDAAEHVELRLWLKLLRCHGLIDQRLRKNLRSQFDTTLARFDLMAQLYRHADGLKMTDLSQRLMVTGGNVTGLVDRLIQDGLGKKTEVPHDRRAFMVSLTDEGAELFVAMAQAHEGWIKEMFSDLSTDESQRLSEVLLHLKQHLTQLEI